MNDAGAILTTPVGSPLTAQKDCATDACDPEACPPDLEQAARVFRALGDETRLAIVRQLARGNEVCACNFTACCDVGQPTVSHHLKILRQAGIVTSEKRGLWVYYRLAATAFAPTAPFIVNTPH